MDKDKLIGALEKLKSEAMGAYYHEGVLDSISLIERWQDEPITAQALQADGWIKREDEGYGSFVFEKFVWVDDIYISPVGNGLMKRESKIIKQIHIYCNEAEPLSTTATAWIKGVGINLCVKTMGELRSLEKVFLR